MSTLLTTFALEIYLSFKFFLFLKFILITIIIIIIILIIIIIIIMREKRNVYRLLVGKPERKSPLGKQKRRWVDNILVLYLKGGPRFFRPLYCDI
jgi:ABC-type Fe3+ transport system permease subunit